MVIDEATALLRRDSTLAASVLRVSNSPVYGGDRISAVEDAVARVGLKEVYRLVSLATTARLAELALPVYGVFVGRLAKTTLLHGIAAEHVAGACGLDKRVAYTAALVRTLGMRVLDFVARECDWIAPAANSDLLGWERSTLGNTNPEVAELVLREWRFGEEVIEAVRFQYLETGQEDAPLMAIVLNVAGQFVVQGEAAIAGEVPYWKSAPEKLEVLGLTPEKLNQLNAPIDADHKRLLEALF
jgi:HD-like signal output (HDOD) protein